MNRFSATAIAVVAALAGAVLAGCPKMTAQPPDSVQATPGTGPAPAVKTAAPAASDAVKVLSGGTKPDFTAKGVDSSSVTAAQYKGKILVMDFWATWCAPCCKKLKEYQPMSDKYKAQGVEFLVFSLDDAPEVAKGWAKENNVTIPMVMFNDDIKMTFFPDESTVAIPRVRILDRNGVWRYSLESSSKVSDVEEAISKLLAEKT
jgi:peroxiredoxin